MSAPAFRRTCMRDHIRDVLVARILDGTYSAGTQLKELSLAREFNVSQAPIREALRELEGSGLVTCERYRGTRVRGADFGEMRESYELRTMLEVRAVELAAPVSAALTSASPRLQQHRFFAQDLARNRRVLLLLKDPAEARKLDVLLGDGLRRLDVGVLLAEQLAQPASESGLCLVRHWKLR